MSDLRFTRRRLLFTGGAGVVGIAIMTAGCGEEKKSPSAAGTPSSAPSASPTGSPAADLGPWHRVAMSSVSAYVLVRGAEAAIVDLGNPGSSSAIETGLKAAGVGWNAVRHVIITHQHSDHAGGTAEIAPLITAGSLYSGTPDVNSINSPTNLKPVNDGDEIFGLRILGTPGHTAGHVSVFDPSVGVLVAGDALRNTSQQGLVGSDPRYTLDEAKAAASVRKLAALDVRIILPGHGDPLTTGAAEALKKLAAG